MGTELKAKMPAYIILTREKTRDQSKLDVYRTLVSATLMNRESIFLVRHGRHEVLEGAATEDVMIAKFPSFDAALAWYYSEEYQAACVVRFGGGDFRCIVVEGA